MAPFIWDSKHLQHLFNSFVAWHFPLRSLFADEGSQGRAAALFACLWFLLLEGNFLLRRDAGRVAVWKRKALTWQHLEG